MSVPKEGAARKAIPVYTGFIKYFPRAILAVAELSRIANDQHNPGQPVHWSKGKSTAHLDSALRHVIDDVLGVAVDTDNVRHKTKVAWRAMADLEIAIETEEQEHAYAAEGQAVAVHDEPFQSEDAETCVRTGGIWNFVERRCIHVQGGCHHGSDVHSCRVSVTQDGDTHYETDDGYRY